MHTSFHENCYNPHLCQAEKLVQAFQGKTSSFYKETGMPGLDLMPMNNGQEQWDALELEKPTKEEIDF